jgi:hypothetical protein
MLSSYDVHVFDASPVRPVVVSDRPKDGTAEHQEFDG